METLQVTWGRKVELVADAWAKAHGVHKRDLLDTAATLAQVTRNSVRPLFAMKQAPTSETRMGTLYRYRAAVLLTLIGETLGEYGLSVDDLPRSARAGEIRAVGQRLHSPTWRMASETPVASIVAA